MMRCLIPSIILLLLAGCAGPALQPQTYKGPGGGTYQALSEDALWADEAYRREAREAYVAAHGDLDAATRAAIAEGKILLGMSREQVRAAWGLHGYREPEVSAAVDSRGTWEYWRFGKNRLMFLNDRLERVSQN